MSDSGNHQSATNTGTANPDHLLSPIKPSTKAQNNIIKRLSEELSNTNPSLLPITEQNINEALKYTVPKEFKAGESIKIKDEKISYEELVNVAKNVENVSDKDTSFNRMPRIFIYPEPPSKNTTEFYILEFIKNKYELDLSYSPKYDLIEINQKTLNNSNKNEVKGWFAHEYGHRVSIATRGIKATEESNFIESRKESRNEEKTADMYATIAGYGNGLISWLKQTLFTSIYTENDKHPNEAERIVFIQETQRNPEVAKAKYDQELVNFKRQASSPEHADNENKQPPKIPIPFKNPNGNQLTH